ncbi:MAG: transporter, partial [Legionellaceae bacterium]|nr:transporter [Legionellaceae bacterium]
LERKRFRKMLIPAFAGTGASPCMLRFFETVFVQPALKSDRSPSVNSTLRAVTSYKHFLMAITLCFGVWNTVFANASLPFCDASPLLNLVDRPTAADSPCVVPLRDALVEMGTQYQKLLSQGHLQNFPETELRIGLPQNSEFFVLLPNYIHASIPSSGFASTSFGIKHEIAFTNRWIISIEGFLTPPSGSYYYGNQGIESILDGIFSYNINDKLSLTGMLGVSTQTLVTSANLSERFSSLNPDVLLTWTLQDNIQLFAEIYGQSKTGPTTGVGYNTDAGITYLVTKNMTMDLEFGHNLQGVLGDFEQYIGAGFAIKF